MGVRYMNIEKFTQNAQQAIMDCQNIAISEGHQMLDGEHLHLALLQQTDGLIPKLLKFMEIDPHLIIADLEEEMEKLLKPSCPHYYGGRFTPGEYHIPEEELIGWSEASLRTPLNSAGYQRYMELFKQVLPEESRRLSLGGTADG